MSKSSSQRIFKLIVHVPLEHAASVRQAIGEAGGGLIGNYSFCSFSTRGIGRFKDNAQSNPAYGKAGDYEEIEEEEEEEESIEVSPISEGILLAVIRAMKAAHPYEETAYQVIELVDAEKLF
ncbi:MAG: hypothetical protein P4L53_27030 [Candidatus Obscuribacterales bacterium]|nr:hypothetical protein [Candidatus Obscuribacterales bacterium]